MSRPHDPPGPVVQPPSARGLATDLQAARYPAALALAGLFSLMVAIGIGRFVYTPILPYMTDGLGLAKSEAGLIASANFLGYLLGALAAAWRAVPGDPRRWLLGALAVSGLSTGAMALSAGLGPFLLLRFANGAAGALVMVLGSSLVMDRLALAGRAGWASVMYAGVGCGIAVSALSVPAIASGASDWQRPWLFCGVLAVALSILVAVLLRAPQASVIATRSAESSKAPGVGRFVLAYGLFGFGYVITATFVSDMVRADPLLQPAEHLMWLCVGLTAAPSAPLWTWAGRRWGNRRAFVTACLIEAAGVALSVSGGGIWHLLLAASLLGGTFVGLTALGLVHVRHLSGGDPRRNLALMTAAFGFGQMTGPALTGVLHESLGGYQVPSLLAAAALVAAAALALRR